MSVSLIFNEFVDNEAYDTSNGPSCKQEGVGGLLDLSLFWEIGDNGANAATFEPKDEEDETVESQVGVCVGSWRRLCFYG